MQNNATILNELREISPVIAEITRQTPYEAPDGYFEGLAAQVMSRATAMTVAVHEQVEPSSPILSETGQQTPFTVPTGYFEEFASKLMARIKGAEAGSVTEELETLSPLLSQLDKKTPFSVPEGYFTDLSTNLVAGMQAVEFVNDELENLSPLMNSLKDKNVYEAPAGYFDTVATHVLAAIKEQPKAKVVSFISSRKWLKYAAAAVVTGAIVTAGFFTFNKSTPPDISKISDQEILNYLETQNEPLADNTINSTAVLDINETDVKDVLGNVSDAELQEYLDDHLTSKDLLTN